MPVASRVKCRAAGVLHRKLESIRSVARDGGSAKDSGVQSGLRECPSISPSRGIPARRRGRDRAANTAAHGPTEMQKLSGGPLCRGVCGHRKMHQTSTVMAENHEREQQLERDGGHDEEI